jgi:hypothetical protein
VRKWRERESSPGSGLRCSPSRLPIRSVALCEQAVGTRYSGGAAPALHRFPCPAFAFSCEAESRPKVGFWLLLVAGCWLLGNYRSGGVGPNILPRRVEVTLLMPPDIRDL